MKHHATYRKKLTLTLLGALLLGASVATVSITGCKKSDHPAQAITSQVLSKVVPPEDQDQTEYTEDDPQRALDDVVVVNGRLEFRNLSHFIIVATALQDMGEPAAADWLQNIGFPNSLHSAYMEAVNNFSENSTQADRDAYLQAHSNVIAYDAENDVPEINAANGMIGRLLDQDHKAVIGGNIFYSDYNADVTVGTADEASIPRYAAQAADRMDDDAYVLHQHRSVAKTTGGTYCLNPGYGVYLGEINCGSPLAKRSLIRMEAWQAYSGSTLYTVGIMKLWHQKRGFLGFWYAQSRGSQVSGTYNGVYKNMFQIYGNQATYHEYGLSINKGWAQVCGSGIGICVAPMCTGNTICINP